jgi:hypothetical protein
MIFHNTVTLERTLAKLKAAGYTINEAVVDDISPHQTERINRFGMYPVDMKRETIPLGIRLN